ncbi:MAG TPA: PH domain-containing protein, partial [Bryobacteraceae bacterium]|nr:PH domain-containing protein [Bryobacteraceae bacterium]
YTAFSVEEVQSVRCTHNPLASPALSLDRLSIQLGFRGNILISPRDKAGFLNALGALDPGLRPVDGSLIRVAA